MQKVHEILQNIHYRKEAFFIGIAIIALLLFMIYKYIPQVTSKNPGRQRSLLRIMNFLLFAVCVVLVGGAVLSWLSGNA